MHTIPFSIQVFHLHAITDTIQQVASAKYLGVTIANNLAWTGLSMSLRLQTKPLELS